MADNFIHVPVPAALVPLVMRLIADHIDRVEGDDGADESDEQWGTLDPWAGFAADDDGATAASFWYGVPRPAERRLLRVLASQSAPTPAPKVADALGMDPPSLAGVVGPLNKSCIAAGYPAPVISRTVTTTSAGMRRRTRVLSISPDLADAVRAVDTGDDEPTIQRKPVARRPGNRTKGESK